VVRPPDARQPRRLPDRPESTRPSGSLPDGDDDARLAPREQARIDEAVVRVARRGPGPVIVAALVAAAFLLGLVRPWDWLADAGRADAGPGAGEVAGASAGPGGATPASGAPGGGAVAGAAVPTPPPRTATCGYPSSWRTSSISFWAGARARIWTAAEAVPANGPDDPAIPFHPIASDTVEALGWCAPVTGPERPPLTAEATLYRLRDGVAVEVPSDLLEPAGGDALGELWVPPQRAVGRRPPWAPGRYVIRLATASGTYERFLGIEVGVPPRAAATTPPVTGSGGPSPGASPPSEARPSSEASEEPVASPVP
jgi:hypothetical protein